MEQSRVDTQRMISSYRSFLEGMGLDKDAIDKAMTNFTNKLIMQLQFFRLPGGEIKLMEGRDLLFYLKKIEQNTRPLEGIWNVPEGMRVWVPIESTFYGKWRERQQEGEGGPGEVVLDATQFDQAVDKMNTGLRKLVELYAVHGEQTPYVVADKVNEIIGRVVDWMETIFNVRSVNREREIPEATPIPNMTPIDLPQWAQDMERQLQQHVKELSTRWMDDLLRRITQGMYGPFGQPKKQPESEAPPQDRGIFDKIMDMLHRLFGIGDSRGGEDRGILDIFSGGKRLDVNVARMNQTDVSSAMRAALQISGMPRSLSSMEADSMQTNVLLRGLQATLLNIERNTAQQQVVEVIVEGDTGSASATSETKFQVCGKQKRVLTVAWDRAGQ